MYFVLSRSVEADQCLCDVVTLIFIVIAARDPPPQSPLLRCELQTVSSERRSLFSDQIQAKVHKQQQVHRRQEMVVFVVRCAKALTEHWPAFPSLSVRTGIFLFLPECLSAIVPAPLHLPSFVTHFLRFLKWSCALVISGQLRAICCSKAAPYVYFSERNETGKKTPQTQKGIPCICMCTCNYKPEIPFICFKNLMVAQTCRWSHLFKTGRKLLWICVGLFWKCLLSWFHEQVWSSRWM